MLVLGPILTLLDGVLLVAVLENLRQRVLLDYVWQIVDVQRFFQRAGLRLQHYELRCLGCSLWEPVL